MEQKRSFSEWYGSTPPDLSFPDPPSTIHSALSDSRLAELAIQSLSVVGKNGERERAGRALAEQAEAISFAAMKLQWKCRGKHQEPAFLHSFRVGLILSGVFEVKKAATLQTGLLHDVLEDSDTEYEELEAAFGESVADNVVLLTKPRFFPKPVRRQVFEDGIIAAREDVILVKLADLYDNLQCRKDLPKVYKTWSTACRLMVRAAQCSSDRHIHRGLMALHHLMSEMATTRPHLSMPPHESLAPDRPIAIAA